MAKQSIRQAVNADLDILVWLARKAHFQGPLSWAQFRENKCRSQFKEFLIDSNYLILIASDDNTQGFLVSRITRPPFIRERIVEIIEVWLDDAPGAKFKALQFWVAVQHWGRLKRAARISWLTSNGAEMKILRRFLTRLGARSAEVCTLELL